MTLPPLTLLIALSQVDWNKPPVLGSIVIAFYRVCFKRSLTSQVARYDFEDLCFMQLYPAASSLCRNSLTANALRWTALIVLTFA